MRLRLLLLSFGLLTLAQAGPPSRGLTFAKVGDTELKLDLYLPDHQDKPLGLIVWVHGGAWRGGSRENVDLKGLTAYGWAVASIDYRLSCAPMRPNMICLPTVLRSLALQPVDISPPSSE
jgi:acetyl esterase/lipase